MHRILVAGLLLALVPQADAADDIDITAALADAKNPKWDPKGSALTPFAQAKTKYRNKQYIESVPGFVTAISKKKGCGECLDYLSSALYYAELYDEAIQVGAHLEKLFPEKKDGPDIIARSYSKMEKYVESTEAIERILLLEDMGNNSNYWWSRNDNHIALGQMDDALALLDTAKGAEVAEPDIACLRIQVLAVQKKSADARELWDSCSESKVLDLKRSAEGWLALAEGDSELAAKRLMLSGNESYARLAISFARLEQEQYEPALNLANKYLEEKNHVDGHLAKALALHGLGRDAEATEALQVRLLAEGWADEHKSWNLQNVLLKPEGNDWPQVVGRRALALQIAILAASGDADGAKALYDEAVAVHGENADLSAALEVSAEGEEGEEGEEAEEGEDKPKK